MKFFKYFLFILLSILFGIGLSFFRSFQDIQVNQFGRSTSVFILGIGFCLLKWRFKTLLFFLIPTALIWIVGLIVNSMAAIDFTIEIVFTFIFAIIGFIFLNFTKKSIILFILSCCLLVISAYWIEPYIQIWHWRNSNIENGLDQSVGTNLQKDYLLDKDSNVVDIIDFNDTLLVIDLWDVGCIECYKKYIMLVDFAEEYKDEKVKFIILFSSEHHKFEDFIRELNIRKMMDYDNIINLYDPSPTITEKLNIYSFPTELIVYNDTIRNVSSGYGKDKKWIIKKELRENIDKLLNK